MHYSYILNPILVARLFLPADRPLGWVRALALAVVQSIGFLLVCGVDGALILGAAGTGALLLQCLAEKYWKPLSYVRVGSLVLLHRTQPTLRIHYLSYFLRNGELELKFQDKPNHPNQA